MSAAAAEDNSNVYTRIRHLQLAGRGRGAGVVIGVLPAASGSRPADRRW